MVPRENHVKRMGCGGKRMSREEGPKKKGCQKIGMPDAKRKRRQRKAAEKTSVSRDSDDIRKTLSGEKCVRSWASQLPARGSCQDSEMTSANRSKRKWHRQKRMLREKHVKEKEFQEMTQPTAVTTRQSGFIPIGSPFSLQASPIIPPFRNFRHPTCLSKVSKVRLSILFPKLRQCLGIHQGDLSQMGSSKSSSSRMRYQILGEGICCSAPDGLTLCPTI